MRVHVYCELCKEDTKFVSASFARCHLTKVHQLTSKEYYDLNFKKIGDDECKVCGKYTKYNSLNIGYSSHCSQKCSRNSEKVKLLTKNTKRELYGNPKFNNRNKCINTLKSSYGVTNVSQIEEVKLKKELTCRLNYGVTNPMKSNEVRSKYKNTLLKLYGIDNPSKLKLFRDKRSLTMIQKYGKPFYSQTIIHRNIQVELGNWVSDELKPEYSNYHKKVSKITSSNVHKLLRSWDGTCYYTGIDLLMNSSEYNESNYRVIDHKFSILNGFILGISPEIIGNINNLCLCSRSINSIKGSLNENDFNKTR